MLDPFSVSYCKFRQEKATAKTGKHQHRDVRRIAAGAGDWAGNGGKDFANAKIVWRVQERG